MCWASAPNRCKSTQSEDQVGELEKRLHLRRDRRVPNVDVEDRAGEGCRDLVGCRLALLSITARGSPVFT